MAVRVAINGFGRIGRLTYRALIETARNDIEVVGINDLGSAKANAHLLKYDSVHGKFNADLNYDENHLIINNDKISFSQESKIEDIDWKKFGVDYVFECTGKFN